MKIALKVTIEMSPEEVAGYCSEYTVDRAEIRQDVKDYVRTALQDSSAFTDYGTVTVT